MSVQGVLGRKIGMTQIFNDEGRVVPVTVIAVEPNVVSQIKTVETDGYSAVQLAFDECEVRKLNRPAQGHLAAAGVQPHRHLHEVEIQAGATVTVGQEIGAEIFTADEKIRVTGTSKGKGFAGVVKRFHFHGADMTHGSTVKRKPQSSGATDAARTFKGTRKPGHMGDETVTQQGLRVVQVDTDRNIILVRGAVPGANGGIVVLRKAHRTEKLRVRVEAARSAKKK